MVMDLITLGDGIDAGGTDGDGTDTDGEEIIIGIHIMLDLVFTETHIITTITTIDHIGIIDITEILDMEEEPHITLVIIE